jgi:hypothetical protein
MSSRLRALLPLLAIVYVAVLMWQAPHTVHHFFEHDAEKQNECALSASAERSTGTAVTSISLVPVAGLELTVAPVAADLFVRFALSVHGPRAPPFPTI